MVTAYFFPSSTSARNYRPRLVASLLATGNVRAYHGRNEIATDNFEHRYCYIRVRTPSREKQVYHLEGCGNLFAKIFRSLDTRNSLRIYILRCVIIKISRCVYFEMYVIKNKSEMK